MAERDGPADRGAGEREREEAERRRASRALAAVYVEELRRIKRDARAAREGRAA